MTRMVALSTLYWSKKENSASSRIGQDFSDYTVSESFSFCFVDFHNTMNEVSIYPTVCMYLSCTVRAFKKMSHAFGEVFFVFFNVVSFSFEYSWLITPWGANTHWIVKVQLTESLDYLIVPFACCLQVTALSTLGFMSPWAGDRTDATVTMGTDTERGPRRGTLQLMMEENPPHTVSPKRTKSTMIGHFM